MIYTTKNRPFTVFKSVFVLSIQSKKLLFWKCAKMFIRVWRFVCMDYFGYYWHLLKKSSQQHLLKCIFWEKSWSVRYLFYPLYVCYKAWMARDCLPWIDRYLNTRHNFISFHPSFRVQNSELWYIRGETRSLPIPIITYKCLKGTFQKIHVCTVPNKSTFAH